MKKNRFEFILTFGLAICCYDYDEICGGIYLLFDKDKDIIFKLSKRNIEVIYNLENDSILYIDYS